MEIEYYYPYILNEEVTSRAECSIQRHTEKETYAGLLDEYKVGLSLIFYLLNPDLSGFSAFLISAAFVAFLQKTLVC